MEIRLKRSGILKNFNEYLDGDSNPFKKQKHFNEAVSSAIDDANSSFEEQKKQISRLELEIKALLNQTNALKSQINKLKSLENQHFSYLYSQSQKFDECMLEVNPQARDSVKNKNIIETGAELSECFKTVKSNPENLENAGEIFRKNAQSQINQIHQNYNSRIIAVICTDLTLHCGMEAIRNEAYDIYNLLRKESFYNVKLISIEKSVENMVQRGDIICVPASKTRECLKKINPMLCIICESTAHVLTANDCGLLMFRSIVRLSGQNPLRDITENTMAELCHLNDFGIQKYCVQSQKAADIMTENGFHEPVISYPVIDINKHIYSCRTEPHDLKKFTVGFASSPMTDEQCFHRGIELLCKTVSETKGVQYLILWRNKDIEVPEILRNSPHCRIEYGRYDMERFYSEIDCVMIPYSTENFNHSCSVSAIEAMLNGIPVISTEVAGVSELVKRFGIGLVTNQFATACNQIRTDYQRFSSYQLVANLRRFFEKNSVLKLIEQEAEKPFTTGTVTLYEWNRLLKQKKKYLVKGHEQMKQYYQNAEIAGNYTAHRFEQYPQNCFDLMERQSVNLIISDFFKNRNAPEILDIACGDGRIVQENIKFGNCTAVDSSEQMLQLVGNRLQPVTNRLVTKKADFITDSLDTVFDAITTFRYIRHFDYKTRKLIYKKIRNCLSENGILIFDVPCRTFELRLKNINGWGNYNIYDVFFTREGIAEELEKNGFELRYMIPVGKGLVDRLPDEIMTWTVGAVKKL